MIQSVPLADTARSYGGHVHDVGGFAFLFWAGRFDRGGVGPADAGGRGEATRRQPWPSGVGLRLCQSWAPPNTSREVPMPSIDPAATSDSQCTWR
jgi:hypothetical protein